MRRMLLLSVLLPACLAAQQSSYPIFESDFVPPAEHKARRARVKQEIGPNGVAIFFTNPERNRNNDVDFRFRGDSNFLYLTGFNEPDAALVLVPAGIDVDGQRVTEILFVNESNPMSETWLGYRLGSKNVPSLKGIELGLPNSKFKEILPKLEGVSNRVQYTTRLPQGATGSLNTMVTATSQWLAEKPAPGGTNNTLNRFVSTMRIIKSPEEIRLLRHASRASALAHLEAMRSIEPGMREYHIQALVEYVFAINGCESPGYPSIVGSGPNSTILHYMDDRRLMQSGDILCMDAGGEYHGYSSDVTRSFPVNGKFSPEQKAIYEIVLKAQLAGIAKCTNGTSWSEVERAASDVLAGGLIQLGIIQNRNELRRYYMHGVGHGIGLDVHDPQDAVLRPGACVTVEPGIYIKAGSPCDPKWWNIGIRIEDSILITNGAPENMSAAAPKTIADIEKAMAEKGLGNMKLAPPATRG